MPGSKSTLTCLEARKQLLLVESELNRAEWCSDCAALKDEVDGLVNEGRSFFTTASFVFAGFKAVRGFWSERRQAGEEDRPGVFALLIKLIKTGASIWRKGYEGKD
jgi:hypothetical protein